MVRFTCGMKGIMIAAMFNVGTSGTIPAIARKEPWVAREILESGVSVNWALTRMSLIFYSVYFEGRWGEGLD